MIHLLLLEIGASVNILNTGATVSRTERGLSISDRCGCIPLKQPVVLDNGVELSVVEDGLVLRHPYGMSIHVLGTGEFHLYVRKLNVASLGITWQKDKHVSARGDNTLIDGDTFDVSLGTTRLALFKQTPYGLEVSSRLGIQVELE